MHANETKIYLVLLGGLVVLLGLIIFFILIILRYHRKTTALRRERISEDVHTLEKERERFAIDLHDDFGATLSAIKLNLGRVSKPGDKSFETVQKITMEVDGMMDRMKIVAHELMPRELSRRGLPRALQLLVGRMSEATGITINYKCTVNEFDRKNSLHIYRIAQEVLNNIVKHSKATLVNFTIYSSAGRICLKISDNGIGFNTKLAAKKARGSGLRNVTARAELLKGVVYLTSEIDKGVTYEIEIPEN